MLFSCCACGKNLRMLSTGSVLQSWKQTINISVSYSATNWVNISESWLSERRSLSFFIYIFGLPLDVLTSSSAESLVATKYHVPNLFRGGWFNTTGAICSPQFWSGLLTWVLQQQFPWRLGCCPTALAPDASLHPFGESLGWSDSAEPPWKCWHMPILSHLDWDFAAEDTRANDEKK